jgi:hypothetical protein
VGVVSDYEGPERRKRPRNGDEEMQKRLIKEAFKEWLDDKVLRFGWFSLATIATLAVGALFYFILISQGWHK